MFIWYSAHGGQKNVQLWTNSIAVLLVMTVTSCNMASSAVIRTRGGRTVHISANIVSFFWAGVLAGLFP